MTDETDERPQGKSRLVLKDGKIEKDVPIHETVDYWRTRCEALDDAVAERMDEVKNLATLLGRFIHATRPAAVGMSGAIPEIRAAALDYVQRKGLASIVR